MHFPELDDGNNKLHQNVGNFEPVGTASCPGRFEIFIKMAVST
jgi:hypothetical protein